MISYVLVQGAGAGAGAGGCMYLSSAFHSFQASSSAYQSMLQIKAYMTFMACRNNVFVFICMYLYVIVCFCMFLYIKT
jgi:hypothetical protein